MTCNNNNNNNPAWCQSGNTVKTSHVHRSLHSDTHIYTRASHIPPHHQHTQTHTPWRESSHWETPTQRHRHQAFTSAYFLFLHLSISISCAHSEAIPAYNLSPRWRRTTSPQSGKEESAWDGEQKMRLPARSDHGGCWRVWKWWDTSSKTFMAPFSCVLAAKFLKIPAAI